MPTYSFLINHINESHPGKNWDEPRNHWHCQLCPRSHINRNLHLHDVFDHMCTEHKFKLVPLRSTPTESTANVITCPDCEMLAQTTGTDFENAKALLDHLKTGHGRRWNRMNKNVWIVLNSYFVKCKECVDSIVKINNLTKHFKKCHLGVGVGWIDGGFCGRCNQRVDMKGFNVHTHMRVLRAHLHCTEPPKMCANNLPDPRLPDAIQETTSYQLSILLPRPIQDQAASRAPPPSLARPPPPTASTPCPPPPPPPPSYTVWLVLLGPPSFLQCPECLRKLPLASVHRHLVRKM